MRLYYWPARPLNQSEAEDDEAELENFLLNPHNWTYDFGEKWKAVQVCFWVH